MSWITSGEAFRGHDESVEDLQWSPSEDNVFASCSVDKTIKVWDTRMKSKYGASVVGHDTDINVISWNRYN
jgi:ribosome assembly protein RRB1